MTAFAPVGSLQMTDAGAIQGPEVWVKACALDFLIENRGVGVLLPDGKQAALFRLSGNALHAVGNIDPFGKAAVMSRGLVGDRKGEPTVASPLLKQVFSLVDGRCLDDESVSLPVYDVRIVNGIVEVSATRKDVESAA